MKEAIEVLEKERKEAEIKFYQYSKRVREGEKKMKEHSDFYKNAEIVIGRLIEILKKEEGETLQERADRTNPYILRKEGESK